MSLDCRQARSLLVAAAGGHANEAERLELESHLEDCAACRAERGTLELVRRMGASESPRLSDAQREKVRAAALAAVEPRRDARPRRRWVPAIAVGALAAGLALAAWSVLGLPESRVLDGDVVVSPSGRGIGDGAQLFSAQGGRVILSGPVVQLSTRTRLVWRARSREAELEQGSVEVEVDPRAGKSFRVSTARFSVEVVGTHFTVDLAGVRTARGKVRVLSPEGAVWAVVGAGEAWSLPVPVPMPPAAPAASATAAPPAPAQGVPAGEAHRAGSRPRRTLDGDEQLARARAALAAGQAGVARAILEPELGKEGRLAAEAQTLRAESFLVEGRYDEALGAYEEVTRTFGGTPQAESALYAVAQLKLEHGGRDEAVRALLRYLERYPDGRFAREARERLDRLSARGGK